jgi:hypothetical protein
MRAHKKLGKDGGSTNFGDDYKEFFLEVNKYLKLLEQYYLDQQPGLFGTEGSGRETQALLPRSEQIPETVL